MLSLLALLVACQPPSETKDSDSGVVDADGDGVDATTDCDEVNPAIHPGAVELCDEVDNNCDGQVDEGLGTTWYADADGDGSGDPTAAVDACAAPEGYVDNGEDCNDLDALVVPGGVEVCNGVDDNCDGATDEAGADGEATWYPDADGDEFGGAAGAVAACDAPEGFVADASDCDDADATINPAADERCDPDDVDENCDGTAEEDGALESLELFVDADDDGYGSTTVVEACALGPGLTEVAGDCDDSRADVNPGEVEVCDDEDTDEDCDGVVNPEGSPGGASYWLDADGDTYGAGLPISACSLPAGYAARPDDCDDTNAGANPGAAEVCDPADVDEDCDGAAEESGAGGEATWFYDADGDGYGGPTSVVACAAPGGYIATSGDCNDSRTDISPAQTEKCDAADEDEDCDGLADDASATGKRGYYVDADLDGYGGAVATVACDLSSGLAADSDDCDDTRAEISPAATEVCDAADTDEDCDGLADDGSATGKSSYYVDLDRDGYGGEVPEVACDPPAGATGDHSDCDDTRAAVSPAAVEVCDATNTDEDCDGVADDDDAALGTVAVYEDLDGDGFGGAYDHDACHTREGEALTSEDCDDGEPSISPDGQEICDGADVDEDCDGLADDADPDVDSTTGTLRYADRDHDGFGAAGDTAMRCDLDADWGTDTRDCDDSDASVSPAGAEDCATDADDNCDGTTNTRDAPSCTTWYHDRDDDGWGTGIAECWCSEPYADSVDNDHDCDDLDASSFPTAWYPDLDGDGYGDLHRETWACTAPYAMISTGGDCNDTRADVSPLGTETWGDSVDDDCDGYLAPTLDCPAGATVIPGTYTSIQAAIAAGKLTLCVDGTIMAASARGTSVTISSATTVRIYGRGTEISTILDGFSITNAGATVELYDLTLSGALSVTNGYAYVAGSHIEADSYASATAVTVASSSGSSPYVELHETEVDGWNYAVQVTGSAGGSPEAYVINSWIHDNTYAAYVNASGSSSYASYWSYHNTYVENGRGLYTSHTTSGTAYIGSYDDLHYGAGLCALSYSALGASNESISANNGGYWLNAYDFCNGVTLSGGYTTDPHLDFSYSPPQPAVGSVLVDGGFAYYSDLLDFWSNGRDSRPDIGCVELP